MTELGQTLRLLRGARGKSLIEVAEEVALSASFLSLVENGKSDISLNRLHRLASYYRVGLADLLPPPGYIDPEVVTAEQRRAIHLRGEGITQYLLAPDAHRTMLPLLVRYEVGGETAERHSHPGDEFIHVVTGQIILDLEGDKVVTLNAGDSVYFSSERGHALKNVSDLEVWVLAVITPPTW